MGFQELSKFGLRPKANTPKGPMSTILDGIIKGVETGVPAYMEQKEKRRKSQKDAVDMYINLRDKGGYTSKEAADAVNKMYGTSLQPGTGGDSYEQEKKKLDLEKRALETDKLRAQKERGFRSKRGFAERFNADVAIAADGGISWKSLRQKYPTKSDEIDLMESQYTAISKDPNFKEGGGLAAWRSKNRAKISKKDQFLIDQIKTEADLAEVIEDREEIESRGYDVDAILEYFGRG